MKVIVKPQSTKTFLIEEFLQQILNKVGQKDILQTILSNKGVLNIILKMV